MLYLFSFKKLNEPIILSKKINISLENIVVPFELNYFTQNLLKYQTNNIGIIQTYIKDIDGLKSLIKIEIGINLEDYISKRLGFTKSGEEDSIEKKRIEEVHNIFNIILFSLGIIRDNKNILDNNIYLQNFDSTKYLKLENKISLNWASQLLNKYLDFSVIEKDLLESFWFFDLNYEKYNIQNFIYVGELLNLYNSTSSNYFRFTQLVAIIEFLLIKGEKDLTQQFKLKTGIIIERLLTLNHILDRKDYHIVLFDNKITIQDLDFIYDIRSHIVHGNLKKINLKIEQKYKKKYDQKIQKHINFDYFFWKIQDITAGLLYLYIREPEYVDFLKQN